MKLRPQCLALILALAMAAAVKSALLLTHSVPFNSDEAIVGLMARHILRGERPTFFYGQAYMGSLDAWLVAGAFRLLGEGVTPIRVVQAALYLGYLGSLWWLARRLFRDWRIACAAVILGSVPPVVVTTYTTASLGGYGESLLLGNLVLGLGHEVTYGEGETRWGAWAALGLFAGLAFWTLGMAVVYFIPVALLGALRWKARLAPYYLTLALAFVLASSPWWIDTVRSGGAALKVLLETSLAPTTIQERILGFAFLGLPTLIGFRNPWSPDYYPLPMTFLAIVLHLGMLTFILTALRRRRIELSPGAVLLLGVLTAGFLVLFLGSHFGIDSTGRLLLPMYLPVLLGLAAFVVGAYQWRAWAGIGVLCLTLLLNGFATWSAAKSEARITTQFDPITRFDNQHDAQLIRFLEDSGEWSGFGNYWVSFRLAFLSDERLIYLARLPYKADLSYTWGDDRYPPYRDLVVSSSRVAYITTLLPVLDERIRSALEASGIGFEERQIGPYHVFFHLSAPVAPDAIGLVAEPAPP